MPTQPFNGNVPDSNIPMDELMRLFTTSGSNDMAHNALYELLNLSRGQADDQDAALGRGRQILQGIFDGLSTDFTNQERAVNRSLFSEAGDQSASVSRNSMRGIARSAGSRGIGMSSGATASQFVGAESARSNALISSRRGIARDFASRMTDHRRARADFAANSLYPALTSGPSMLYSDALASTINFHQNNADNQRAVDAAKDAQPSDFERALGIGSGLARMFF